MKRFYNVTLLFLFLFLPVLICFADEGGLNYSGQVIPAPGIVDNVNWQYQINAYTDIDNRPFVVYVDFDQNSKIFLAKFNHEEGWVKNCIESVNHTVNYFHSAFDEENRCLHIVYDNCYVKFSYAEGSFQEVDRHYFENNADTFGINIILDDSGVPHIIFGEKKIYYTVKMGTLWLEPVLLLNNALDAACSDICFDKVNNLIHIVYFKKEGDFCYLRKASFEAISGIFHEDILIDNIPFGLWSQHSHSWFRPKMKLNQDNSLHIIFVRSWNILRDPDCLEEGGLFYWGAYSQFQLECLEQDVRIYHADFSFDKKSRIQLIHDFWIPGGANKTIYAAYKVCKRVDNDWQWQDNGNLEYWLTSTITFGSQVASLANNNLLRLFYVFPRPGSLRVYKKVLGTISEKIYEY